jgi:hypothetical protein
MGPYYGEEQLASIMERADLLVLPSHDEGFPLVLNEAAAYGVPFVATDVGAVRIWSEDNPDVRIVPLDNGAIKGGIEDLARGIREGTIRGDRLQQYHRRRYGFDVVAEQWLKALLEPEQYWGVTPSRKARNRKIPSILREHLLHKRRKIPTYTVDREAELRALYSKMPLQVWTGPSESSARKVAGD